MESLSQGQAKLEQDNTALKLRWVFVQTVLKDVLEDCFQILQLSDKYFGSNVRIDSFAFFYFLAS